MNITEDSGHIRETMRMLVQAVRNRWDIPESIRNSLPRVAIGIIGSAKNERDKLRALELLAALDRDNIAALVALDRIERLDEGSATEIVEFAPIVLKQGMPRTNASARPTASLPSAVSSNL